MKKLNFKDPQGRTLVVNSPDDSVPSEQELDQMFSKKYSQPQQPSRPTQTIPQMLGSNLMKSGRDTAQSAGVMLNTAGFGLPGFVSEKVSGQNIFEGKDLSSGQKMMAGGAGLAIPTGALLRPLGMAGKAVTGSRVGKAVGKTVTSPFRYVKDLIKAPGEAKKLAQDTIFDIEQNTRELARKITTKSKIKERVLEKNYSKIEKGYSDLEKVLDYSAQKAGHREAISLQKELPKHFSRMSTKYGGRLKSLIGEKDISVPANKVVNSLEESLMEKCVIRFDPQQNTLVLARSPQSAIESKIYNAYQNTKNLMSNKPEAVIDATDLIRTNNIVKPKYGKKWTPDEYMQARVVEK